MYNYIYRLVNPLSGVFPMIRSTRSLFTSVLLVAGLAACVDSTAPLPAPTYVVVNDTTTQELGLKFNTSWYVGFRTVVVGKIQFPDGRHSFKVKNSDLLKIIRGPFTPTTAWDEYAQLPVTTYDDGITISSGSAKGASTISVWHPSDPLRVMLIKVTISEFWPGCTSANGFSTKTGWPCNIG